MDRLRYYYENGNLSNTLHKITDNEGSVSNPSGYPGGGGIIDYDLNGNMTMMPDKSITQPIVYNYLNLPQRIVKYTNPVTYTYRADGVKVHKLFEVDGQQLETWYLDGFVYSTPYKPLLAEEVFIEKESSIEIATVGQREAFELAEKAEKYPVLDPTPIDMIESSPDFFSTAEGFYDYNSFKYIY